MARGKCQEIGRAVGYWFIGRQVVPVVFPGPFRRGRSRSRFLHRRTPGLCIIPGLCIWGPAPSEVELSVVCHRDVGHGLEGRGQVFSERFGVGEGGGFRRLGARKGIPAPQFFPPVPDWLFLLARRVFDHATSLALFCLGRFLLHFAPVVPRGFAFPIGPGHSRRFVMEIVPAGDAGWHHVPGDALYERLGKR